MPRVSKLTDATQKSIVDAVRAGNHIKTAAAAAGVGLRTVYDWLERGEKEPDSVYADFALALNAACAEAEMEMLASVRAGGPAARGNAWALERRFPKHWGSEMGKTRLERDKLRAEIRLLKQKLEDGDISAPVTVVYDCEPAPGALPAPADLAPGGDPPRDGAVPRPGGGTPVR
jgi:transposase